MKIGCSGTWILVIFCCLIGYHNKQHSAKKVVAAVDLKERQNEFGLVEKVKIQFNAKRLSGNALLEMPKITKQTGNWSEEQNLELKLANN